MKVVVVIPHTDECYELVEKVATLHKKRAGVECEVYTIEDTQRKGGFAIQNEMAKELEYDYYCYSWIDYYPAKNYLKYAIEAMHKAGKGMCVFNDGKWEGSNATAGILHKKLLKTNYESGDLFYPEYKQHFADPDLTHIVAKRNQLVYEPKAVLIEIDYDKDIFYQPTLNFNDQQLFEKRWFK